MDVVFIVIFRISFLRLLRIGSALRQLLRVFALASGITPVIIISVYSVDSIRFTDLTHL